MKPAPNLSLLHSPLYRLEIWSVQVSPPGIPQSQPELLTILILEPSSTAAGGKSGYPTLHVLKQRHSHSVTCRAET